MEERITMSRKEVDRLGVIRAVVEQRLGYFFVTS